MTTPGPSLDARLATLLQGLDTSADFDARVMSRVRVESTAVAAEEFRHALLLESTRYGAARRQLSWRTRLRRAVTLDTVGISVLALFGAEAIWAGLPPQIAEFLRQYAPEILTAIGVLLAVAPIIALGIGPLPRRFDLA